MRGKFIMALAIILALSGTGVNTYAAAKNNYKPINGITVNKINFQTLKEGSIPSELATKIESNKSNKGYISLVDDITGYIYIAVLMGEKPTTGYSVSVNYVEDNEGRTKVFVSEKKPGSTDMLSQVKTYPYIVIRAQRITPNISVVNEFNEKYQNLESKEKEDPIIGVSTITGKIKNYEENDNKIYLTIEDSNGDVSYYFTDKTGKWADKKSYFTIGDKVIVKYALGTPAKYKDNSYFPFSDVIKLSGNDEQKTWKDLNKFLQVPQNKEWKIKLNEKLVSKNVNNKTVYILDSKGKKLPIKVTLEKDKKSIKIKPMKKYAVGETYYLYISKDLQQNSKTKDIAGYRIEFTIEKDIVLN